MNDFVVLFMLMRCRMAFYGAKRGDCLVDAWDNAVKAVLRQLDSDVEVDGSDEEVQHLMGILSLRVYEVLDAYKRGLRYEIPLVGVVEASNALGANLDVDTVRDCLLRSY